MKRFLSSRLAAATLAAAVVLPAAFASTAARAAGGDAFDAITERMENFIAEKKIAGAVTLVSRRGECVHHESHGMADIERGDPMHTDTLFGIASMTKPVTATAILILQDEGKLSIEDPVSKFLPEFAKVTVKGGGAPARPITIRDLMTHTAGIVSLPRPKAGAPAGDPSLEEIARRVAGLPLEFEPGAKWKYSWGLTICGRIVEVVSGKAFDAFLDERIFEPLGMRDTTFHPDAADRARMATMYQPGDAKDPPALVAAPHPLLSGSAEGKGTPNPSGGLFSTASDMARFYQAILNGGALDGTRIVSANAVAQMTRVQTGDLETGFTPGNGWGLGWCVVREPQGVTASLSPGTFGHGGAWGTQGWVDPVREMVFVLLIQRTGFGNSDGSEIRAAFHDLAVEAIGSSGG